MNHWFNPRAECICEAEVWIPFTLNPALIQHPRQVNLNIFFSLLNKLDYFIFFPAFHSISSRLGYQSNNWRSCCKNKFSVRYVWQDSLPSRYTSLDTFVNIKFNSELVNTWL